MPGTIIETPAYLADARQALASIPDGERDKFLRDELFRTYVLSSITESVKPDSHFNKNMGAGYQMQYDRWWYHLQQYLFRTLCTLRPVAYMEDIDIHHVISAEVNIAMHTYFATNPAKEAE
jgi:hypothetical protein